MAEPHSTAATPPSAAPEEESAPNGSQTRLRSRETQHVTVTSGAANWNMGDVRDDSWSCCAVVFSFWFFVSVTMILGVYGTVNVVLGPKTSIVYHPSPVFVQYMKVENVDEKAGPAPILYGTYQNPSLDVVTTWGETRNVSLPPGSHKEWKYYLNRGSEVNISYHVSSEDSSVFLIIADGADSLSQWLENPTHPNTTLSWNMILGTGMITQEILWSSGYYVAVGNLGEEVEVELNLSVKALLHNTTNAYYKCVLTSPCSLNIFFPEGNAAVIVSPGPQQNTTNEWYVTISYGPRWVTYIIGIGGMTLLMFWAFNFLSKIQGPHDDRGGVRPEGTTPQRAPLLSQKDDDLSSWGSSYDSLSQDEEDLDFLPAGSIDGNVLGEGETSNSTRRLCAICFDAPRDCFFLPCGHCAACFPCGTRLAEAAGTCPVCRRNMKKVRKIFTV